MSKKTILITGCSSGFGMLMAARLASKGHRVFATMRDVSKKERLIIETEKRKAIKNLTILPLDVTKPDTIKAAVKEIVAEAGVIDVLVNNAGFGMAGFFEDLTDQDFRAQYEINFFGVLNVIREVMPIMRPRKKGLIINISSMAAFSGTPSLSAYASSKWALEGFSECLYMELKPLGINVALVEPGAYRTKIFEDNARYGANFYNPQSPYFSKSQHLKNLVAQHIKKNYRDPEEVSIVVEDIVNSPWPKFRNIIGIRSRLRYWLVRLMPFELYAELVNRAFFPKDIR